MAKITRILILMGLSLALSTALLACGGDQPSDSSPDPAASATTTPTAAAGTPGAGAPAATPAPETPSDADPATVEYAAAMEEIFIRSLGEAVAAVASLLEVSAEEENDRIRALRTSEAWSNDDAAFASRYAETWLEAVTDVYEVVVRASHEFLDGMLRLSPPERLSDLHSEYNTAYRGVVQLLEMQLEIVKNADTEIKSRQELSDFDDILDSVGFGSADSELEQQAEELSERADAACLALTKQLEAELEREVNACGI